MFSPLLHCFVIYIQHQLGENKPFLRISVQHNNEVWLNSSYGYGKSNSLTWINSVICTICTETKQRQHWQLTDKQETPLKCNCGSINVRCIPLQNE